MTDIPQRILQNVPLSDFTTFRIGGPARFFCEVHTKEELVEALTFAEKLKHSQESTLASSFFILGGGSNVLVSDKGFPGLVIKIALHGIVYEEVPEGIRITSGAGESWDDLVSHCVDRGLYGLENLSLIPGTVGAAPVQNIGAYGCEVKNVIFSVEVYDTQAQKFVTFSNSQCQFNYRDSVFKHSASRYIIVSVTFILKKSEINSGINSAIDSKINIDYKDLREYFAATAISKPTLKQVRQAIISIRTSKLPDILKIGTAGSFFKNPIITTVRYNELKKKYPDLPSYPVEDAASGFVKVPAAWILDHVCGFKGSARKNPDGGEFGVYKNQALVLVNYGNASAQDIQKLAQEMADSVKEKTGIILEPEVHYVG